MTGALPQHPARGRSFVPLALVLVLLGAGCSDAKSSELPEWTPADHDNQGAPARGQVDTTAPRAGMPALEEHGVDDVVLATWKQNCVTCHGVIGRGDGPQGVVMRPTDLTDPTWHRKVADADIALTIKNGRGKMPAFGALPDRTVQGLVRLVRLLDPERSRTTTADQQPTPPTPPAAAPTGSTPPAGSTPPPPSEGHGR